MGPIELALTAGTTAVAVPLAKDLLGKLLGPSAELLGERLRENLIAVLGKAETMAQESGVELTQIPARTGVPILEAARLEDDDWMRERWATLLFNAANPESTQTVRPAYVEILKQLSPQDAKFLNKLVTKLMREREHAVGLTRDELQTLYLEDYEQDIGERVIEYNFFEDPTNQFDIVLENLIRLRLLSDEVREYQLTKLSLGFFHASNGPDPRRSKPAETHV